MRPAVFGLAQWRHKAVPSLKIRGLCTRVPRWRGVLCAYSASLEYRWPTL